MQATLRVGSLFRTCSGLQSKMRLPTTGKLYTCIYCYAPWFPYACMRACMPAMRVNRMLCFGGCDLRIEFAPNVETLLTPLGHFEIFWGYPVLGN